MNFENVFAHMSLPLQTLLVPVISYVCICWFVIISGQHPEKFLRNKIPIKRMVLWAIYLKYRIARGRTKQKGIQKYKTMNYKPDISFYRAVNNSNYGWRALRLLARRSPHFFQPTNQQFKSLPEYLENMVIKLAKELPVSTIDQLFMPFSWHHL